MTRTDWLLFAGLLACLAVMTWAVHPYLREQYWRGVVFVVAVNGLMRLAKEAGRRW